MFDRAYFENVLPDQLRLMGHTARLTLTADTGIEYEVRALVAAHDAYVVLEVYGKGKELERNKRWQAEHPNDDPSLYDQVALPYERIAVTHLTARVTARDARTVIGFQQTPSAP